MGYAGFAHYLRGVPPILLFSDVDGVLREPQPFALARAAAILAGAERDGCTLVLCSRYTRAELEFLQQRLRLNGPFIAECGAAVFVPLGYFSFRIPDSRRHAGYDIVEFSRPHDQVMAALRVICRRLRLDPGAISDMTVEEAARARGVSPLRGRLAKFSEYIEPCRPVYSDRVTRRDFARALEPAGLALMRRGDEDFIGDRMPPGLAVAFLRSLYERQFGRSPTIAVVDDTADEILLPRMGRRVIVPEDKACDGAGAVVGWAEAIAETIRTVTAGTMPAGR
jgi:predicted mannosyl-3-phosphoglycerate phosphatase (HAD superfamily)